MSLHRLTRLVMGVPDPTAVGAWYERFGLAPLGSDRFATADGGEQLHLVATDRRRLVELGIGADDLDDLDRVERSLGALDVDVQRDGDSLSAVDPGTDVRVRVSIADRLAPAAAAVASTNAPGRVDRPSARAAAITASDSVRPRKLGHVVLGSTDLDASNRFFVDGVGFKVSDTVHGLAAFLRCSTDHHNLLVQRAPIPFLHHTSWQVDDADQIGRAATSMLDADPTCHVWGMGRHTVGSNLFWYLRDPAGSFAEYHADLDVIVDDEVWRPQDWTGRDSLYRWGPPVPGEFLAPPDVVALVEATSR
jgi:catechol 2,3-dioxygenase-like lactoylglutathione lyase family enzyme